MLIFSFSFIILLLISIIIYADDSASWGITLTYAGVFYAIWIWMTSAVETTYDCLRRGLPNTGGLMDDFVENYEILWTYIILYAALVLLLLIDPEAHGGAWLVLPVSLIFPLYELRRYRMIKKMHQSTKDCTSD